MGDVGGWVDFYCKTSWYWFYVPIILPHSVQKTHGEQKLNHFLAKLKIVKMEVHVFKQRFDAKSIKQI
jgi:hypothetical protein